MPMMAYLGHLAVIPAIRQIWLRSMPQVADHLGSGHHAFVMRYYTTTFTTAKAFVAWNE